MHKKSIKKIKLGIGAVVLVFGILFLSSTFGTDKSNTVRAQTLTIYKSPTCGCCANYVAYMKRAGYEVTSVDTDDMDAIKDTYKIPSNMESCHTTVINDGEYVVEGHIPFQAIDKLMEEKPQLKAIMMPGMPAGSPGMPGLKQGLFEIYGLDENGDVSTYTQI
ncbi:MAG: hypothetical protein HYV41_04935 [Candidatus Magasanikbacteria bacterium]|nr:hypothetical protein [Candidatus Magasanikbacteria bacterium]